MKYFFTTHIKTSLLLLTFVVFGLKSNAQETGISPYSRLGLGDANKSFSPAYSTMGGASVSLSDFNLLNNSNPASYSKMMQHMPVFEVDGATQLLNLKSTTGSGSESATTFTRLAIGIPVNKRLGLSLGLLPYTTTGYDITSTNNEQGIGEVSYLFNGKGGINKTFIGAGYSLLDKDSIKLSVGFNFGFLFGNIEKARRVEYPEDDVALNSLLRQKTGHNGFNFDIGLQYTQKVTSKFSYSLGAALTTSTNLNANREEIKASYTNFSGSEFIRDTISYVNENKGTMKIPLSLRLGGSINLNNNLEIAIQYQMQDWSQFDEDFTVSSVEDSLASSNALSFGLRYTPSDVFSSANYYERIEYRFGFRYENTPMQFNNTQITEFGTSFGLGFPIRKSATSKNEFKSLSMINVGVDFGKRGTTDNGLIQENFTHVYFGISIMPQARNRWFVKRKFN